MGGRLAGKVCVVSGGAQGIGAGIAKGLATEGAAVVIADLKASTAAAFANELVREGLKVSSFEVDVAERDQVAACFDYAIETFGGLDVVFNNAGFNKPMKFLTVTEDNWNAIQRVNAWGVMMNTQEAAKRMIAQGRGGKIVNTASIAGRQGYPDIVPYCSSKAAVIMITQGAARELAQHGITVNGFAPGVVATPLWDTLDQDLMAIGSSTRVGQAIEEFSAGILLGRPAVAEDLAGMGVFLASSDSDYMTGQILMFDGGMVLV
jgi:meso-butanediol dehydrogenase/(S,S)-butanediol dehydrogenase/diacetyl reductase